MEYNDKESVKNLFKIFVILILFTIICMQAFSIAKYIKTEIIENINLSVTPPPKKLLSGAEFNMKLKDSSSAEDTDSTITKIVFDYWDNGYMEDETQIYSANDWINGIAIDFGTKGAIKMFKSDDGKMVYILSESKIYANVDSEDMFYNLNSIVEFEFNNFNVYNVENMDRMFGKCTSLEVLDLSSFNTVNTTSMKKLFTQNENLTTIYVGQMWDTEKVDHTDIIEEDEPFLGCISLVGENGTTYKEENIDISFACIDQGEEEPGYFTYKDEGVVLLKNTKPNEKEELKQIEKENEDKETENQTENTDHENKTNIENTTTENKTANEIVEENQTANNKVNDEIEENETEDEQAQEHQEEEKVESTENEVVENKTSNETNNV